MKEKEYDLNKRTKQFALDTLKMLENVPDSTGARVIRYQLAKSATSVGANYRSACKGRSKAEFIAKLGIVEEEADESVYWLELLIEGEYIPEPLVGALLVEAKELVAIIAASKRAAGQSRRRS